MGGDPSCTRPTLPSNIDSEHVLLSSKSLPTPCGQPRRAPCSSHTAGSQGSTSPLAEPFSLLEHKRTSRTQPAPRHQGCALNPWGEVQIPSPPGGIFQIQTSIHLGTFPRSSCFALYSFSLTYSMKSRKLRYHMCCNALQDTQMWERRPLPPSWPSTVLDQPR